MSPHENPLALKPSFVYKPLPFRFFDWGSLLPLAPGNGTKSSPSSRTSHIKSRQFKQTGATPSKAKQRWKTQGLRA